MTGARPARSEVWEARLRQVLTGREALARAEGMVAGGPPARDPAVAEGLALAGARAASLSDGSTLRAGAVFPTLAGSCVHHVVGAPGSSPGAALELAASSAQEALDHALAAHRLSRRLGRAVVCSLTPSIAGTLALVSLPRAGEIDALFAAPLADAGSPADAAGIVEVVSEELAALAERTGRGCGLIEVSGAAGAGIALVAAGGDGVAAQEAARALAAAGCAVRVVAVKLVRPLPLRELSGALAGTARVFVVEDPASGGALYGALRGALAADVRPLRSSGAAGLSEALAAQLPDVPLRAAESASDGELRRLVVAPGGPWGEAAARELAALVGRLGPLQLAPRTREHLGATVLGWRGETLARGGDLLLTARPAFLSATGPAELLRAGSAAVVLAPVGSLEALVEQLEPEARAELRDRKLDLYWVPPAKLEPDAEEEPEESAALVLVGAGLAALAAASGQALAPVVEPLAEALEREGLQREVGWLRHGARELRPIETSTLDPARGLPEVDFRPASPLPRLPDPVEEGEEPSGWAERIRRFRRRGNTAFGLLPGLRARPAAVRGLSAALRESACSPFALVRSPDRSEPVAARPLRELLAEGVAALQQAGSEVRVLADNRERLASLAAREVARGPSGASLASLLREAGRRLVAELALPPDDAAGLARALEELVQQLPGEAPVLEPRPDTPLHLYLAVLEAVREPLRRRFTRELTQLRERLSDLLELDHLKSEAARRPDELKARLGRTASDWLDLQALARTLPADSAAEALSPDRRERIERARAVLDAHLASPERFPGVVLVRPPDLFLEVEAAQREHAAPLAAAVGVFDGLARGLAEVFRAARVARLESAGAYCPERHDAPLAELNWESFTEEELLLVPAVAVVTTGARLRHGEQGSLSELLTSARPVHVLVTDDVAPADEVEDLSRFHLDLGSLAVAHREAYVLGSGLARPATLTAGLVRALTALRPAVVLVSVPSSGPSRWRLTLAEAALQARTCPDFRYDPAAGSSWADRLDLSSNPQPERPWPLQTLAYRDGDEEKVLELPFTFADAAALEPAYLRHLRIIPRAAWSEEQLPLASYLERFEPGADEPGIPFLWMIDEHNLLQRAVLSRELTLVCVDRLRSWRVLQELAGYANVFAQRAAAAARAEALTEAERERSELERSHLEELERVRVASAQESMDRLAAVLMSPEGIRELTALPGEAPAPALRPAAPVAEAAGAAAPAPPAAPETAAAAAAAEPEDEGLSFDEPYIDTPLCTTCNECTNINSQMFKYNAEKQAFLANARAGTFAELVRAAELCPARCIHPGKPRSDDTTANADLVSRAAAFNT